MVTADKYRCSRTGMCRYASKLCVATDIDSWDGFKIRTEDHTAVFCRATNKMVTFIPNDNHDSDWEK